MERLSLISCLAEKFATTVAPLIGDGSISLLDFPDHTNVGDSAIWAGEARFLRCVLRRRASYVCTHKTYDADALKKCAPSGPILIHGGGNFGDVWPKHQTFRLRVLRDFPDRPVIQLPQSIHYSNVEAAEETRHAISAHGRVHLLVRDQPSYDFAKSEFSCPVTLCPDAAFFLGPLRRTTSPQIGILKMMRTDHERASHEFASARHPVEDWVKESYLLRPTARFQSVLHGGLSGLAVPMQRIVIRYDLLSNSRLMRGVRQLSRAGVVITDRLHVHILCILLSIPHVALDNCYGKIARFSALWTKDAPDFRRAESMAEAEQFARDLLSRKAA